jgi:antitoxin component of MazEF toxin-antitoxin module
MIEIKTKLRKWGNSFGVVVPQNELKNSGIEEGENVIILLKKEKENNVLKETFGTLKFKKPADKIMKEVDKELDINF